MDPFFVERAIAIPEMKNRHLAHQSSGSAKRFAFYARSIGTLPGKKAETKFWCATVDCRKVFSGRQLTVA
jgi:hypothetical protein